MKKIIVLISLLFSLGLIAFAQTSPLVPIDEDKYKTNGFSLAKELWMSNSYAYNVNMSLTALGAKLANEGEWYEVIPGAYTKAKNDIGTPLFPTKDQLVSLKPVSNIFNVTGRGYGVYEFLYLNKVDYYCGFNNGDQVIFRIYVVPDVHDLSVKSDICDGTTTKVDLYDFLRGRISNFCDIMGWKIKFYYNGVILPMPLDVNSSLVGIRTYIYEVDDSDPTKPFYHKYTDLVKDPFGCRAFGTLVHTVSVVGTSLIPPSNTTIAYFLKDMQSRYPQGYTIDVTTYMKFTAPDGVWSVSDPMSATVFNPQTSRAIIDLKNRVSPSTIDFKYEFTKCDKTQNKGEVHVYLLFAESQTSEQIVDKEVTVCRNDKAGPTSLYNMLGVSLPFTAGTWVNPDNTTNVYGEVNISSLKTNSTYVYKYYVSSAATEALLSIKNYQANVTLNILDPSAISSGEAQLCKSLFDQGNKTVNLNTYVANIPTTGVLWFIWDTKTKNFVPVTNAEAYPAKYPELNVGTNLFKFVCDGACGASEGNLYLSVNSLITNFTNKEFTFCYSDLDALSIDLFQLLGVAGLSGEWTMVKGVTDLKNFDKVKGIFKGAAEYGNSPAGEKVYQFEYTIQPDDGTCYKDKALITIKINDNIII